MLRQVGADEVDVLTAWKLTVYHDPILPNNRSLITLASALGSTGGELKCTHALRGHAMR